MADTTTTADLRTLGPGILTFKPTASGNAKSLSADVTKVQLSPNTSTDDPIDFLDGSQAMSTPVTTWELSFTIQDWYGTGSAAEWLFDHAGEEWAAAFTPVDAGTTDAPVTQWTMHVMIAPIAVGGDVKSRNTNDVTLTATQVAHTSLTTKATA